MKWKYIRKPGRVPPRGEEHPICANLPENIKYHCQMGEYFTHFSRTVRKILRLFSVTDPFGPPDPLTARTGQLKTPSVHATTSLLSPNIQIGLGFLRGNKSRTPYPTNCLRNGVRPTAAFVAFSRQNVPFRMQSVVGSSKIPPPFPSFHLNIT